MLHSTANEAQGQYSLKHPENGAAINLKQFEILVASLARLLEPHSTNYLIACYKLQELP